MGKFILNGKTYTGNGADGFPPLIYSDDEREVGVWRDGKPLYQKTYITQNTTVNSAVTMADLSSQNIDTVVDYYGEYNRYVSGTGDNIIYKFNSYQSSTVNNWIRVLNKNTLQYQINQNSSAESTSYQAVTILYTKTTDTAGSGYWSTNGDRAIHYSTTEQVIGTWVDGKPLYEKTVYFGSLSSGTQTVTMGLSNPNVIVDISIRVQVPSGAWCVLPMVYLDSNITLQYGAMADGYNANTDKVTINVGSSRSFTSGYIIIQYTKTTD